MLGEGARSRLCAKRARMRHWRLPKDCDECSSEPARRFSQPGEAPRPIFPAMGIWAHAPNRRSTIRQPRQERGVEPDPDRGHRTRQLLYEPGLGAEEREALRRQAHGIVAGRIANGRGGPACSSLLPTQAEDGCHGMTVPGSTSVPACCLLQAKHAWLERGPPCPAGPIDSAQRERPADHKRGREWFA